MISFFSPVLSAQSVSEQRRETYYQNLEARARSLSQKLAEISGTEPIPFHSPKRSVLSTMESNPTNASPQTAYDSLPGPIIEPVLPSEPQGETLYRADGTPVILKAAPTTSPAIDSSPSSVTSKRAIRRNMEKERGSYFIQPFIGVALPSSSISLGIFSSPAEVETKVGNIIGLSVGRRWDNLEGEIHFGYSNVNFGEIS